MSQLPSDSILIAEFEYIAQGAFQVSEDRAKVSSFYLVTVGSIFAAILGANISGADNLILSFVFALLFTFLALNGLLTLLKLAQLRMAWLSSVQAMNAIKTYYLKHCGNETMTEAITWLELPKRFKAASISFLLAVEVALLSSFAYGAAVIFAGRARGEWLWLEAGIAGILYLLCQVGIHRILLKEQVAKTVLEPPSMKDSTQ